MARSAIAPEVQLASNERFHDLLESYVYSKAPAHALLDQEEQTGRLSPSKQQYLDNDPTTPSEKFPRVQQEIKDAGKNDFARASSGNGLADEFHSVTESTSSEGSQQEGQDSINVQEPDQSPDNSQPVSLQKGLEIKQSGSAGKLISTSAQHESALPAPATSNSGPVTPEISGPETSEEQPVLSEDTITDATLSCAGKEGDNSLTPENREFAVGSDATVVSATNEHSEISVLTENVSSPQTENTADETHGTEPSSEKFSAFPDQNTDETGLSETQLSHKSVQQPLLYQKTDNGVTTTHIEMNVGSHEKVHVQISGNSNKENRIHIDTDNPEIYQSLKDNQGTLIAALSENSVSIPDLNSMVPSNIQINLSKGAFLEFASDENRFGDDNHSASVSHSKTSQNSMSRHERRTLRSVVDFTV
ncbi:flagellar hook-length control protein FliK [Gluconobacter kanchanaburiensis]|uniref:flagellar hook-length control protein FliK n=1 Tax=Gluconobacter kanchanaburiensis TaxID=563199 RepID=UPI0011BE1FDD|nr:flagellar hook-length control protein FliK [Gluconobacter kanchanaburiensis]MBF0862815.1 flagellar hook-length control protein FliK [Gluconobacter kanchanaburiensis]